MEKGWLATWLLFVVQHCWGLSSHDFKPVHDCLVIAEVSLFGKTINLLALLEDVEDLLDLRLELDGLRGDLVAHESLMRDHEGELWLVTE